MEPKVAEARVESPDVETSSDGYAKRFSGSVGEWFLDVQARAVRTLLAPLGPGTVLEVGGGHAQLAGPLREDDHEVTVLGGDPSCAMRIRRAFPGDEVPFVCSALDRLPCRDQSVDVVLSVRTMAHVEDPVAFLRECARVARKAVVIDFASTRSVNRFTGLLFGFKHMVEKDTRPYRVFRPSEPAHMIADLGFEPAGRGGQFFWPMALHRAHGSVALARALEFLPRTLGLAGLYGSPVVALFRRRGAA